MLGPCARHAGASRREVVGFVQRLRVADLTKVPGRGRDARLGGCADRRWAPASCRRRSSTRPWASCSSTRRTCARVQRRDRPPLPRGGAARWPERARAPSRSSRSSRDGSPAIIAAPGGTPRSPVALLGTAVELRAGATARRACRSTSARRIDFSRALTLVDIGDRERGPGGRRGDLRASPRGARAPTTASSTRWWRALRSASERRPTQPPADATDRTPGAGAELDGRRAGWAASDQPSRRSPRAVERRRARGRAGSTVIVAPDAYSRGEAHAPQANSSG